MAYTTVILQAITIAANFLTIVSLVIAAGLFGNAYFLLNTETDIKSRYCPLYLNHENVSKNAPCVVALIFEVLAASGLLVLIKASIWKLIRQDFKNKRILIIEIIILVISIIFALMGMIILSSGWGVTCESVKFLKDGTCTSSDIRKKITASVAFAVFSIPAIVTTFIITIVIAVMIYKQSTNILKA